MEVEADDSSVIVARQMVDTLRKKVMDFSQTLVNLDELQQREHDADPIKIAETLADVYHLKKQIITSTTLLNNSNRQALLSVRTARDASTVQKEAVDRQQLELDNLYYRHQHLRQQIANANNYKSHVDDNMPDITPVQEFIQSHPEFDQKQDVEMTDSETASSAITNQDKDDNYEYELTLARLKDTKERRSHLESKRQELIKRQASINASIKDRKTHLTKADKELFSLVDHATKVKNDIST